VDNSNNTTGYRRGVHRHPTAAVAGILLAALMLLLSAMSTSAQSSLPIISVQPYCDQGTNYFAVTWIKTNTAQILATVTPDMAAYVPSGNQTPGYCAPDTAVAPLYFFTTSGSDFVPAGLNSWIVTNIGAADATIAFNAGATVGGIVIPGGLQTLAPGQWITCATQTDVNGTRRTCEKMFYDATGTTLSIFLKPE